MQGEDPPDVKIFQPGPHALQLPREENQEDRQADEDQLRGRRTQPLQTPGRSEHDANHEPQEDDAEVKARAGWS